MARKTAFEEAEKYLAGVVVFEFSVHYPSFEVRTVLVGARTLQHAETAVNDKHKGALVIHTNTHKHLIIVK